MTRRVIEPATVYRLAAYLSLVTLLVVALDLAELAFLDVDRYVAVFDLFLVAFAVDFVAVLTYLAREPFQKRYRLRGRLVRAYLLLVVLATLLSLDPVHRVVPIELRHYVMLFVAVIATGALLAFFRDPQLTLSEFGANAYGEARSQTRWRRRLKTRVHWRREGHEILVLSGVVVALVLYHPAGPQSRVSATVLLGASLLLSVLPGVNWTDE